MGVVMEVRKVRGQNKIHPIRLSKAEMQICHKLALKPESFIYEYVKMVAKKRRWKWFFEQKENAQ